MNRLIVFFSFIILVLIVSCTSRRYISNYDKTVDFEGYNTFSCSSCGVEYNKKDYRYYNPEIRDALNREIRKNFTSLGYEYNESDPDLVYEFTLLVQDLVDTVDQSSDNPTWAWQDLEKDKFNYRKGSLILNLVDVENGKLIWQSKVESQLDRNPKNIEKRISRVLDKMFINFPTLIEEKVEDQ